MKKEPKETKAEIVPVEPAQPEREALVPVAVSEIGSLMKQAIEKGPDGVAALERLVDLRIKVEERDARKAFNTALMDFQQECPPIRCNRVGKNTSRDKGSSFEYPYADLNQIVTTVRPLLVKHGLSFKHDSKPAGQGLLEVLCTLKHIQGHFEVASFPCPTSSNAGMSDQQKYASALTFARRQSLIQVLGLTTTDKDADGGEPPEPITEAQANTIEEWLSKCHDPAKERALFLNYLKVGAVGEIPAHKFEKALSDLVAVAKKRGST